MNLKKIKEFTIRYKYYLAVIGGAIMAGIAFKEPLVRVIVAKLGNIKPFLRKIWKDYGKIIKKTRKKHGVSEG